MHNELITSNVIEQVEPVSTKLDNNDTTENDDNNTGQSDAPTDSLADSIMKNLGQIEQYMREVLSTGAVSVGELHCFSFCLLARG